MTEVYPPDAQPVVLCGVAGAGSFRLEVDLTLQPGEVVAVLGPNGAGKTTLLRTLAGLNPLQSGQIRVGERVVDDAATDEFVPPEHRQVGLVFQNYRLFPHLNVRDNVGFAARAGGASRAEARRVAEPWVRRLGLTELADRRPRQLSGGQSQRVVIARALASEPDLLLLDEPLAALDHRTRTEVRSALREHLVDFAGPVLMVTHDPIDAMVLADRLIVIEDGRVVQDAAPAEVARRPRTAYVARLVGLNLYAGVRDPATGVVTLDDGATLHATADDEPLDGGRVLISVRPAAISVHQDHPGPASPRNVWPARVTGMEALGDRVRLAADGPPAAIADLTPEAVADLGLHVGARVWLSAKATEVLAYPDRVA
jgi:molybdate transport system ATP-binding protein